MATKTQSEYIADLAVLKTKEFKEVKELVFSTKIVTEGSEVVGKASTIAEICNALTDKQASQLIDVLIAAKAPTRANAYSSNRVNKTIAALEDIKSTIADWDFTT